VAEFILPSARAVEGVCACRSCRAIARDNGDAERSLRSSLRRVCWNNSSWARDLSMVVH